MGSVTHETLVAYQDKIKAARKEVVAIVEQLEKDLDFNKEALLRMDGQLLTIQSLMDYEAQNQVVEMPLAEEAIMRSEHERRLDFFPDVEIAEFAEQRKENVYKKEALDTIDKIDALNTD